MREEAKNTIIFGMSELMLTAGVLSDTHLPYRMAALPAELLEIFAGVDVILHAGDVDRDEFLLPLRGIAPVYAVRGNFHISDGSSGGRNLPYEVLLTLAGRRVVIVHGHRRGIWGFILKIPQVVASLFISGADGTLNERIMHRLKKEYPTADVVVFGHTHRAFVRQFNGMLFFNPGAVAETLKKPRTVGVLRFYADKVEAEIIPLRRGNG